MLKKLNQLSAAAYVRASLFVQELKSDERGLSGVVVAVLAIVMLWGSLSEWLGELWDKITGAGGGITGGSSFGG